MMSNVVLSMACLLRPRAVSDRVSCWIDLYASYYQGKAG
jgi:hypothetical protein